MAIVTGKRPRPNPCKPRPTTMIQKLVDTADSTQPASTTARATTTTRRFRGPSASRPMAGVANAPVIRAAVSSHWAVLKDTPSERAIAGMSGAPRLLTTATKAATETRTGSVARRRQVRSGHSSVTAALMVVATRRHLSGILFMSSINDIT